MGFSILVCAGLTFHDPAGVVQGTFVPTIPPGAGLYVLSIIGGIGGSVTMLSYNYWMREEKIAGPGAARVRARRHRDRVSVHRAVRHGDHDDREPGVLRARRDDHERAGRARRWRRCSGSILGTFGRVRVLDWILGRGVRVAARRVAERAVSVRGFLQHPQEAAAGRARARDESHEHAVPARADLRHARADSVCVYRAAARR